MDLKKEVSNILSSLSLFHFSVPSIHSLIESNLHFYYIYFLHGFYQTPTYALYPARFRKEETDIMYISTLILAALSASIAAAMPAQVVSGAEVTGTTCTDTSM